MKYAYLICLSITIFKGCSQEFKGELLESVRYSVSTRGYYYELVASPEYTMIKKDRNLDTYHKTPMSQEDWNTIINMLKRVDVYTLENLETQTGMSSADRAAMAELSVVYDKEEYITNLFDEGSPPGP
ncbi:hypothetical protein [Muriicola soli]|uniref:Uncharacterized protein n=1 Tax=Muriicola soli TaxID=2507538 RepID=A0A411ECW0_9FLAO|nr:hypothetical protein [Muriicola soli]QBA65468.1 hypothetical protein EQY75_13580 [Muriicola soli]